MSSTDHYNLRRFLDAQQACYDSALGELKSGRKRSHWIWYIFPQVAGLGYSAMSQKYAIESGDEARAYLAHPVLGSRLRECCSVLLVHKGTNIASIMGYPDNLKLCSCMTLFSLVSRDETIFSEVLDTFYDGRLDERTAAFLHG